MPFLLDTNVISESMKPHPEGRVVRWLAACDEETVFLSVATIAEIRFGPLRIADPRRRREDGR